MVLQFRGTIEQRKSGGIVDRVNEIIRGVQIMQPTAETQFGEVDLETVQTVVRLGAARASVKSRFGHPNISTDSLGTFLGDFQNFRMEGDKALADLHFDPTAKNTPRGNLSGYLMDLADSRPDRFGMSVVMKADKLKREPVGGKEKLPLLRPTELMAIDAVDQGAATSGLFGADTLAEIAPELGEFSAREMVKVRQILRNPKALAFCQSLLNDFSEDGTPPVTQNSPHVSLSMLERDHPDIVKRIESRARDSQARELMRSSPLGLAALRAPSRATSKPKGFMEYAHEYAHAYGVGLAQAIVACQQRHPEAHERYRHTGT